MMKSYEELEVSISKMPKDVIELLNLKKTKQIMVKPLIVSMSTRTIAARDQIIIISKEKKNHQAKANYVDILKCLSEEKAAKMSSLNLQAVLKI